MSNPSRVQDVFEWTGPPLPRARDYEQAARVAGFAWFVWQNTIYHLLPESGCTAVGLVPEIFPGVEHVVRYAETPPTVVNEQVVPPRAVHGVNKFARPAILVVDNFLEAPDALRGEALAAKLNANPARHKGTRSEDTPIPEWLANALCGLLEVEAIKGYVCFQSCVAGDQLVYHSDTQRWAAVIYLTPNAPPSAGTSTFRSKATGVRHATEVQDDDTARKTYGGKLLDRTAWDEVDRIGNVYNRLAVYDARLVHSASDYFGTTVEDGRLFLMAFFDVTHG